MDYSPGARYDGGRVLLHTVSNPLQHDADEGILIEAGNKLLILRMDGPFCRLFLHDAQNQTVDQRIQILLNPLPADGAVPRGRC